ncbi:putative dipeptidase [Actinoplanes missouriensis 431]|uniref:Putative dipeptidase n=1 Tax=Actinoplanes missouriensis (strain ATCC 14538 / DSM 43046 / CBS 188.64 / JCM 3121 / NBRC 102363 / NCIMB 12654 / NRRL B-3342 / UNCC 431) TaxID=512565 RepID=I0HAW1_ACTM4|nr:dipeptidase [Actinoplanes missouriensis]BAL90148.1 putative dipeptidase [Actinoplanes missouriensis 431]
MTLIIDGHNDLPMRLRALHGSSVAGLDQHRPSLHTDLPRLRAGGVGGQFWSVYVPSDLPEPVALTATLEQIDLVHRMVAAYPGDLEIAHTAADVERIMAAGRIASLIGVEGGHCLAGSTGVLRSLARLGIRYVTLTHNHHTAWADSAAQPPVVGGLSAEGRDLVRDMQRLGVLVDLSHVAPVTMHAALDVAGAPVIFSHSGARAVTDHPRNVPDDVLTRLPGNGGVAQLTFVAPFVSAAVRDWAAAAEAEWARLGLPALPDPWPRSPRPGEDPSAVPVIVAPDPAAEPAFRAWLAAHPKPAATIAQVADHVDHARAVAGVDHVGLGGDFDGTTELPAGLPDVSGYPRLLDELRGRGWSEADLTKLASGNILRAMRDAESRAGEMLWPVPS